MEPKPKGRGEELSAFLESRVSQNILSIDALLSTFISGKKPFMEPLADDEFFDIYTRYDLKMPEELGGYSGEVIYGKKGEVEFSDIQINPPNLFVNNRQITKITFETPVYFEGKKGSNLRKLDPKHKFHITLDSVDFSRTDPYDLDLYQFLFDKNGKPNFRFVVQAWKAVPGLGIDVGDFELIAPAIHLLLNFIQNAKPVEEFSE